MRQFHWLLILAALASGGCTVKSRRPIEETKMELRLIPSDLTCRVSRAADELNLGFHYGTSDQPYGKLSTYRLIGSGFEIVLYNPEAPHTYYLSVYQMRPQPEVAARAKLAFHRIEHELLAQPTSCHATLADPP